MDPQLGARRAGGLFGQLAGRFPSDIAQIQKRADGIVGTGQPGLGIQRIRLFGDSGGINGLTKIAVIPEELLGDRLDGGRGFRRQIAGAGQILDHRPAFFEIAAISRQQFKPERRERFAACDSLHHGGGFTLSELAHDPKGILQLLVGDNRRIGGIRRIVDGDIKILGIVDQVGKLLVDVAGHFGTTFRRNLLRRIVGVGPHGLQFRKVLLHGRDQFVFPIEGIEPLQAVQRILIGLVGGSAMLRQGLALLRIDRCRRGQNRRREAAFGRPIARGSQQHVGHLVMLNQLFGMAFFLQRVHGRVDIAADDGDHQDRNDAAQGISDRKKSLGLGGRSLGIAGHGLAALYLQMDANRCERPSSPTRVKSGLSISQICLGRSSLNHCLEYDIIFVSAPLIRLRQRCQRRGPYCHKLLVHKTILKTVIAGSGYSRTV